MATASAGLKIAAAGVRVFRTALVAFSGPVGWVTAGLGALAAGAVAVVKWLKRDSEETKRLKEETAQLSEATSELTDEVESNAKAYEKGIFDIEGTAKANEDLMSKVTELADKENKSAGEKEMLAQYTDQLNESVEGLNLAYDEEADMLNMSSDNMKARLKLFEEQEKANAGMERTKEITQELTQVEKELEEVNRLRIANNGESKEVSADLNEQEQLLTDTYRALRGEYEEAEGQVEESMEGVGKATKEYVYGRKVTTSEMCDTQRETIDDMYAKCKEYKDESTSIFDALSDEIEVTYDDLMEMLEENQRVTEDYHKNMAELTKRGLQEGILDQMKEAGYDAAGYAAMMVDLTDEELKELNNAFEGNMKSATEGGLRTVTDGNEDIIDSVGHLVTEVDGTLSERML